MENTHDMAWRNAMSSSGADKLELSEFVPFPCRIRQLLERLFIYAKIVKADRQESRGVSSNNTQARSLFLLIHIKITAKISPFTFQFDIPLSFETSPLKYSTAFLQGRLPSSIIPFSPSCSPRGPSFTEPKSSMHKTKVISKDFIRDCRMNRERDRRENTVYAVPPLLEEDDLLPLPDYHFAYPNPDNNYSIEDFIQNLQSEQFIYFNEECFEDYENVSTVCSSKRSLEQVNLEYLERIGELPKGELPKKVAFEDELRVKYFKDGDSPECMKDCEEFCYSLEESVLVEEML